MESYGTTFSIKRLWTILVVGMVVMFGILLLLGQQIYQQAPPIPEAIKSANGETLFTRADIDRPECLAVDRRHGARLNLGPRQLSCT